MAAAASSMVPARTSTSPAASIRIPSLWATQAVRISARPAPSTSHQWAATTQITSARAPVAAIHTPVDVRVGLVHPDVAGPDHDRHQLGEARGLECLVRASVALFV